MTTRPSAIFSLRLLSSPTDDARLLISELDAVLHADSPPENRHGYPLDRLFQPHILFFLVYMEESPVGCGGIAFSVEDRLAEIKRMYVRPQARGRGVAQLLLHRLEQEARNHPSRPTRLVLETGDNRHAALSLYTKYGFSPCDPFAPYTTFPPHTIAHSVFLQKPLACTG